MLNGLYLRNPVLLAAAGNFVWREQLGKIITTALLSMVPTFEGRYAVIVMIGLGIPAGFAFVLAVLCSTLPVPFVLWLLRPILDWFYTLPIKPVQRFAAWLERRSEKKRNEMRDENAKGVKGWLRRHVSAETMELILLYIFVAVPLTGTGCWTGSAIATLFDMPKGKSIVVILLGNITACAITTLITVGAVHVI